MPNPRPRVYNYKVHVRVTAAQHEALRQYAAEHETAISIVLREAALVLIGRKDLSLAKETEFTIGDMIDRKDRTRARRTNLDHDVSITCNLTGLQLRAIERAASQHDVAVSAILREAGLAEAGIAPAIERPAGGLYPRGHALGSRHRND